MVANRRFDHWPWNTNVSISQRFRRMPARTKRFGSARSAPWNKEGRPGVMLRVFERDGFVMAFVPWGTGTPGELPQVVVRPNTAAGTALGIYKPTYFRKGNVTICQVAKVELCGVSCPPRLMLDLKALFGL